VKRQFVFWLITSAVVMLLFPWLISLFVPDEDGMAACLLLLFAIDPIYSFVVGFFAGKGVRYFWSLPLLSALLFLSGALLFWGMNRNAALLYAAVYLLCAMAAVLISRTMQKKKQ
jgi:hypothetical protein